MKKSLFTKILTVVGAAVLTLPAVLGMNSNTVKAANADDQNKTVILTKYGFSSINEEAPETNESNWKPEGSTPLEGVDFKVFDVTANYWYNPSEYAGSITIPKAAKVVAEGTTDAKGQIKISLPKYSIDANGKKRLAVYLFRETDQRSGYGTAADFWLTLDKPNKDDGNVYVYPKNEQVETYQRHFKKIDGNTGEILPDAKFVITNGKDNQRKYLQLTKKDGTPVTGPIKGFLDTLANNYRLTWISEKDEATVFVSDDKGIFGLNGFKNDGTYGYEEIEAPAGYELLTDPGSFTPEKDTDHDEKNPEIIKNTPKGLLPHTGGKGIVAFVVAGVALIALGGLAYSKRRAA